MSNESSKAAAADRRGTRERRQRNIPVVLDRRKENRRGERRRQVDPTTCERDYTEDEITFMTAMDQYKRDNRRPFPSWSEVLEVLKSLGYDRVAQATALPGLQPKTPPAERRKPRRERRSQNVRVALDRRKGERRGHPQQPTDDELTFMQAMDQYKRDNRRPFPTWSEVLEVLRALGYRKVKPAGPLPSQPPPKG